MIYFAAAGALLGSVVFGLLALMWKWDKIANKGGE
jgi:hypothetical protein